MNRHGFERRHTDYSHMKGCSMSLVITDEWVKKMLHTHTHTHTMEYYSVIKNYVIFINMDDPRKNHA